MKYNIIQAILLFVLGFLFGAMPTSDDNKDNKRQDKNLMKRKK